MAEKKTVKYVTTTQHKNDTDYLGDRITKNTLVSVPTTKPYEDISIWSMFGTGNYKLKHVEDMTVAVAIEHLVKCLGLKWDRERRAFVGNDA